ncbi:hypothetical protein [Pontitalea aquivivens]|uniref:hypothetical protein n=1 Tax=Pontitalea aquivivens TaxID=3388663 RepID=UPI003970841D
MKSRDSQRSKLYKAEREAWQVFSSPLATVADIRQYLERQSTRKPLQHRYGDAINVTEWELEIADGRGTLHAAAYGSHRISIPLWARNNGVVLHEWAHIIHNRLEIDGRISSTTFDLWRHGSRRQELRGGASHGWQFAAIYLDLVHFCIGKEAAAALKEAFKKHKVRYRPKRTRVPTQEQLERLATMRAARTTPVVKAA